jgi:hypothetical protein
MMLIGALIYAPCSLALSGGFRARSPPTGTREQMPGGHEITATR